MFKLNEALNYAAANGRKIEKQELAKMLWPDAKPGSQSVNMSNLVNGITLRIQPEWIGTICAICTKL